MRYQAPQLHLHCTACHLNKAALIRYQAPEASCASDKPVRHRLCRLLVHALRRLRSVQFTFTLWLPFSFLAKPFSVAAGFFVGPLVEFPRFGFVRSGFSSLKMFCCCRGFLEVPWWNSLCLVLRARFFVLEILLLLPRGFWRSPGGIPSVWLVSAPPGPCVCEPSWNTDVKQGSAA